MFLHIISCLMSSNRFFFWSSFSSFSSAEGLAGITYSIIPEKKNFWITFVLFGIFQILFIVDMYLFHNYKQLRN